MEPAAYSSVVRPDAHGEVWYSVDPLNILPGIAEARGYLDGASATYETLRERCDRNGLSPTRESIALLQYLTCG